MSSNKIIDRKIARFITNRDKLKNLGHEIAMLIFDHANEHGDCTRAIKLAAALPNSWQPQMEAWFKAFSPIRVVIKNGKCEFSAEFKKVKAATANRPEFWDREAALATPFYEVLEEPKVDKTYDFAALVKMVERLAGQIEKKVEEGKVPSEDIESAKAIARTVAGLSFSRVKANDDEGAGAEDDTPAPKADADEGFGPMPLAAVA